MEYKQGDGELCVTERVGLVVWLLAAERGRKHTTADIARRLGVTYGGAWAMLGKLARVLPIAADSDGWWMLPDESRR